MESVESEKKETNPDVLCNCRRSRCVFYRCRCVAALLYCDDGCRCDNCQNKPDSGDTGGGNSASSSSAGHKKGCKCQKIKCQNTSCRCYRDEVGCSMRCRCQDCANSFGKKPEPVLRGAEYWKNRSRKMRNKEEVMSDSTKVGTANQLSPTQEKHTHMNHLTGSTHPGSSAVPSLTSHNIGEFQNVSQAESENGTNFHGYWSALSPKQPCPSKEVLDESLYIINNREMIGYEKDDIGETIGDDLNRLFSIDRGMIGYEWDDIRETKGDDLKRHFSIDDIRELLEGDDIIMEDSNPTNTMKFESPGQPTAASMPCSPTPTTCCNTEDRTSQTEIHHQGGNHDK